MIAAIFLSAVVVAEAEPFCCYWPVYPADCDACEEKHSEVEESNCLSLDQNTWCDGTSPPSPPPAPPSPPSPPSMRKVAWWWYGDDDSADVTSVVDFVKAHPNIVSSVIMNCGPHLSKHGTFVGDLSKSCKKLIPKLVKHGVQPELWLGESDDLNAHHKLFNRSDEAAEVLVALGQKYGLKGMNIDLEANGQGTGIDSTPADAVLFADFLRKIRPRLNDAGMRLTVDVDSTGWCPILANVPLLASVSDKVMDMGTYSAGSYFEWWSYYKNLMSSQTPLNNLGVGLGCGPDFVGDKWAVTAESVAQRICNLMNDSVVEIDMFDLFEGGNTYPKEFWLPQLEKFVAGGGCEVVPPVSQCPESFLGPNDDVLEGCCTALKPLDCEGSLEECSKVPKQQCEAYKSWQWQDVDWTENPYTCCPPTSITSIAPLFIV